MPTITPTKRKLKLYENATQSIVWRLTDQHDNAINLTGWSAKAQIKEEIDGELILAIESTGSDAPAYITIDGAQGKITLVFNPVLESYAGQYDLFLIDPDGRWHKLVAESSITVIAAITDLE